MKTLEACSTSRSARTAAVVEDAGEGVAPRDGHRPGLPRPVALPRAAHRFIAARDAAPLPEEDRLVPQRGVVWLPAGLLPHLVVVLPSSPPLRPYPLHQPLEPDVLHRQAPPRRHRVRHREHGRDRAVRPDVDHRHRAVLLHDDDVVPDACQIVLQVIDVDAEALGRVDRARRGRHLRRKRGAGSRDAAAVRLPGPGGGAPGRPGARRAAADGGGGGGLAGVDGAEREADGGDGRDPGGVKERGGRNHRWLVLAASTPCAGACTWRASTLVRLW